MNNNFKTLILNGPKNGEAYITITNIYLKNKVDSFNNVIRQQIVQVPKIKKEIIDWSNKLQKARTAFDNDSATLHNVSEYHALRMPETRKEEISDASAKLEADRTVVRMCSDSITYYRAKLNFTNSFQ